MNCARIIYGNQVATNGVVHVIDRVISAVGNTMQDTVEVNDDLTTLAVSIQNHRLFMSAHNLYLSEAAVPLSKREDDKKKEKRRGLEGWAKETRMKLVCRMGVFKVWCSC